MGIIARIILGALAGWIASMIKGRNHNMGAIANIIVGIIGAAIGGFVFRLTGGSSITGLNLYSLLVSVVGAVILLSLTGLFKSRG